MANINPAERKFSFEPLAMLPAWLVTDESWIVRNCNPLAEQLVESLCPSIIPKLKTGTVTVGEVHPRDHRRVSLWACLLNLDKRQQSLVEYATGVMAQHVEILRRYRENSEYLNFPALMEELRRVQGIPGVFPYVFDRCDGEDFLRIGIRLAPRGGLELRAPIPVSQGNREEADRGTRPHSMTHVEIALAYRVRVRTRKGPTQSRTTLTFLGSQPAIHDSTGRSVLEREMEDLRVTSNITHALMTPLSNAFSAARRINNPGNYPDAAKRLSGRLLAQISEAESLVRLLVLVNTHESLTVTAKVGTDPRWPTITRHEIRYQFSQALMSIFHLRTDRGRDLHTIRAILNKHRLTAPEESNGDEVERVFSQLANTIVSGDVPSFFLTSSNHSPRLTSFEVAELAKSTALQLILTELIINAVKHSDTANPDVTFQCVLSNTEVQWTVGNSVSRTGSLAPQEHRADRPPGVRQDGHGLGRYLNEKVAGILSWKLDTLPRRAGWEAHCLCIPLEYKEPA